MKYILDLNIPIFNNDRFSKREAFSWLITNSTEGTISVSLRHAANVWQWHYSAVKRFLDKLKSESLITIISYANKTTISIPHYDKLVITKDDIEIKLATVRAKGQNSLNNAGPSFYGYNETKLKQYPKHSLQQEQQNPQVTSNVCNSSSNTKSQDYSIFDKIHETNFEHKTHYSNIAIETNNVEACSATASEQDRNNQNLLACNFQENVETKLTQHLKHSLQQNLHKTEKHILCNTVCNSHTYKNSNVKSIGETKPATLATEESQKEEKKKRSKKRKEEKFKKEKDIPFRDIQKEKIDQIKLNKFTPYQLVEISDVKIWVKETGIDHIDLSWELSKFKDYWQSTNKASPKDGIAAFRNWIRRSIEITNHEEKHDKFSRKHTTKTNDFERFVAAGARVLAMRTRN